MLENVTWADDQRLLEIRGGRAVPRLTYVKGVLELMTPSLLSCIQDPQGLIATSCSKHHASTTQPIIALIDS